MAGKRQKTDAKPVKLTAKQEKFAQFIADGMTQTDAYKAAYDASRMNGHTIRKRASEMAARGDIAGTIAGLRQKMAEKLLWTREKSVEALIGAQNMAKELGQPQAVTGAIKELNAMHGFNAPVKVDHSSSDGTMTPRPVIDAGKLSTEALEELLHAVRAGGSE